MDTRKPSPFAKSVLSRTVIYALMRGAATAVGTLLVQILWLWISH